MWRPCEEIGFIVLDLALLPLPPHRAAMWGYCHRSLALICLLIATAVPQSSQHEQVVFGAYNGDYASLGSSSSFNDQVRTQQNKPVVKRIAIIGAGPGGTSTAYFLSKAQEKLQSIGREGDGFEITLFEREERIGGRTAIVHPYFDDRLPVIELGASIFADVNRNLKRAVEVCHLPPWW